MVCLNSVESAIDILWNGPRDLEIEDISFESGGKVETLEHTRRWEFGLLAGLQAIDVIGVLDGSEGEEVCHFYHVIAPPFSGSAISRVLVVGSLVDSAWSSCIQILITMVHYLIGFEVLRYSQESAHSPTSEECCRYSRQFDIVEYTVSTYRPSIIDGPRFYALGWISDY